MGISHTFPTNRKSFFLTLLTQPRLNRSDINELKTIDRAGPNGFDAAFHSEIVAPIGSSSGTTPDHVDDDALRLYHERASILQSDGTLDVTSNNGYPQYIDPSYLSGNQLGEWNSQGQHMGGYGWHSTPENNVSTGVLPSFNANSAISRYYQTNHPNLSALASNPGPSMTQGFPAVLSPPALSTCDWSGCNTIHLSSSMLAHWTSTHLGPISDLMKLQPPAQKQAFCLWNDCHKAFNRRPDLDRHVQSVHLGVRSHCTVSGCDNNGGKGFPRLDKLKAHEKKYHGAI